MTTDSVEQASPSQLPARRGLAVYFAILVPLTVVFQAIIISTGDSILWLIPLMWSPAAASIAARLVLREGFADVSFRLGGSRTWIYIVLALILPLVIGLVAFGIAWTTGLARFDPPQPTGLIATLAGAAVSPLTVFLVMVALAATIGTLLGCLFAAGEEIGWRGYMLTRLIDAGVPRPILVSGVIWGLWHVPLIFGGLLYVESPSPALAATVFMVSATSFSYVMARLRLETGSIWPAIVGHSAYNSIIQAAFHPATKYGAGAGLWVDDEAGILVALALVVTAVVFSRGSWTYVRSLPGRGMPLSQWLSQQPARVR
jgi:membrane protease YdiL (CAAX protease family)